ncbi:MAG: hypothetical protein RL456_1745, partial [Pseudomonadota bacterium]
MDISRVPRRRPVLEAMEPRILHAADLAGAGLAGLDLSAGVAQVQAAADASVASRVELVVIDRAVPDAGALVAALRAQRETGRPVEVLEIGAGDDGIARLGETLQALGQSGRPVSAVHLIGHGEAGAMQLGASRLDALEALGRAGEIAAWSAGLAADADLLLYGCDTGAGEAGRALVDALAALSGADVAASDDLTGATLRGGDWDLEVRQGAIESGLSPAAAGLAAWDGVLAVPQPVNVATNGLQTTEAEVRGSAQSVAADAQGNFVVVWTDDAASESGTGVYARLHAADGTALGDPWRVAVTTEDDQKHPRVARAASGEFAVVWTSVNQDGSYESVYLRRFAADGTALTGEIRVHTMETGLQSSAVVGLDAQGGMVVAWAGDGPAGSSVYVRRFGADGTPVDPVERLVVNGTTGSGETAPALAMRADGGYVVAWTSGRYVHWRGFGADGQPLHDAVQADNVLADSVGPAIAVDAQGRVVVAYRDRDLSPGVWVRGFEADGSQRFSWFKAEMGDGWSPAIAIHPDGSFTLAWETANDGDGHGIRLRHHLADGSTDGASTIVNTFLTGDQVAPSLAWLGGDRLAVAWSGVGAGDGDGVFVRTVGPEMPQIVSDGAGPGAALAFAEGMAGIVTTVVATDADTPATALTYRLAGGADAARYEIDPASGQLKLLAAADFEHPDDADGDGVHEVVVAASDGVRVDTQALRITITDVPEPGRVVADVASTPHATPVTLDVLANDLPGDASAGPLVLLDVSGAAGGTASLAAGGIVYTPRSGFVGTETLGYRAVDTGWRMRDFWSLDGTTNDAVGGVSAQAGGVTGTDGVWDGALQFDGTTSYMRLASPTYTDEFTLAFWFRMDGNAGNDYRYMYSHGTTGSRDSVNVYFIEESTPVQTRNNVLRTSVVDSNGPNTSSASELAVLDVDAVGLADNTWHLYTLTTRTGQGAQVFIDGVLRASDAASGGGPIDPGTAYAYVGAKALSDTGGTGGGPRLDVDRVHIGGLDDLQILGRAVSAADALTMYQQRQMVQATVTIDVVAQNLADPVITSDGGGDTATLTVAEGTQAVTVVRATDADLPAPSLTYRLAGGADAARFGIDAASGALTFLAAPDAEAPTDAGADGRYEVIVQVDDGARTDAQTLAIQVLDVDEHPVMLPSALDPAGYAVDESAAVGTLVGLRVQATDADLTGLPVSYLLEDDAGGRFAIDAASGEVRVAGVLDAEAAMLHTVRVRATSADGGVAVASYDIQVRDLDEFDVGPPADASDAPDSVREDAVPGVLVGLVARAVDADATLNAVSYGLDDSAGGRFAIDAATGEVRVAGALDAETATSHTVIVRATSADGSVSTRSFAIAVTDVNEMPVGLPVDVDMAVDEVAENAAAGTVVGLTIQSLDPDLTVNGVTYALKDDAGGRFAIDPVSGVVRVSGPLDAETARSHTLVVEAIGQDGSRAERAFTVAVLDVNESSVTVPGDGSRVGDLPEDIPVGTEVGVVTASDGDATNSMITYRLVDDAGGRFAIDALSGVLSMAGPLDAETALSHTIRVRADGSDGSWGEATFHWGVLDIDEYAVSVPVDVDAAVNVVAENAAVGTAVGLTAQAVDLDATQHGVSYALLDDAGGRFAIDAATGVVRVAGALDAETTLSHALTVEARSEDGSRAQQVFVIAVGDVDESAVSVPVDADGTANAVAENAAVGTAVGLTAQSSDADATQHGVSYALLDDAGGRFAIDAATGVVRLAGALDAETALSHALTVEARSEDGSRAQQVFVVAVGDVDESAVSVPVDVDAAVSVVAESAAVGTVVGLTAQAVDLDATQHGVSYALLDDA